MTQGDVATGSSPVFYRNFRPKPFASLDQVIVCSWRQSDLECFTIEYVATMTKQRNECGIAPNQNVELG